MAEESESITLEIEDKKIVTWNYQLYNVKISDKVVYAFQIQQINGCCGTAHICCGEMKETIKFYTPEIKNRIFEFIKDIMISKQTINLIYQDITNGHLNTILKDFTEPIYEFENPNSDNKVEHRIFTIDIDNCPWVENDDDDYNYDGDDNY